MNREESATDRPLRDFGLWLSMLGPPSLWLLQFQTVYILVYPACGAGRNFILGAACLTFFVLIALLAIYPAHNLRAASDNRVVRTRHFMSLVGLMSVLLSLLLIFAQWMAAIMVDPCVI